jgi:MoaA/NifB/PqqE/SkfB family radical SAM enzyme
VSVPAIEKAPFVLIPQAFGSLVFERGTSRYLPFDAEATALLEALAGRGRDEVVADEPSPARRRAILAFCDTFADRGFFDVDGHFRGATLPASPPRTHILGPLVTHVEVIATCNLACAHCSAPLPRRELPPLSLAELDALFAELAALGSFRLGLTGGEPLARRDLLEVIDAAVARGLHPCLTTNGLLLDDDLARALARRDLVWLNVSLDGATAATNDAVRGVGTFARVLDKIGLLRRAGARFTLAFTVTSANGVEAADCARLARALGAHTAVYPAGAAREHRTLMPTFAQYSAALAEVAGAVEPDGDVRAIDPFSPQARAATQARVVDNHGCGAANLTASVSVGGDVSPCSFLGPGFEGGNLRRQSFVSIWNDSPAFSNMRALSRRVAPGRFAGGCRARSLALAGDVDAADPWQLAHDGAPTTTRPPGYTLEVIG